MSLVYVFFIFRFYDLLHSLYYSYTSHTFVRSYSIIYFVLSYTFCTFLVLAQSQYFHTISLVFVLLEVLSHLSYLP